MKTDIIFHCVLVKSTPPPKKKKEKRENVCLLIYFQVRAIEQFESQWSVSKETETEGGVMIFPCQARSGQQCLDLDLRSSSFFNLTHFLPSHPPQSSCFFGLAINIWAIVQEGHSIEFSFEVPLFIAVAVMGLKSWEDEAETRWQLTLYSCRRKLDLNPIRFYLST